MNFYFFRRSDPGLSPDSELYVQVKAVQQAGEAGHGEPGLFQAVVRRVYRIIVSGTKICLIEDRPLKDGLGQVAVIKNGF